MGKNPSEWLCDYNYKQIVKILFIILPVNKHFRVNILPENIVDKIVIKYCHTAHEILPLNFPHTHSHHSSDTLKTTNL